MLNRILLSVILIPVVCVAVYLGFIPFLVFICAICFLSAYEFWTLVEKIGFYPRKTFGNIVILLIVISIFFNGSKMASLISNEATSLVFTLSVLLLFIYEVIRFDIRTALPSLAITFLGVIYIGWLPGHFILIRDIMPDGFKYTIVLLATVWIADSVAYFIGTAYGVHPLSRVSPKKTIEGSIASIVASILTILIAKIFFLKGLNHSDIFFIGVLVSISAQFGDLAESLIKRSAGVKDSSKLIKNHGGMLDKLDSFIFAAPVYYYYLKFFVL